VHGEVGLGRAVVRPKEAKEPPTIRRNGEPLIPEEEATRWVMRDNGWSMPTLPRIVREAQAGVMFTWRAVVIPFPRFIGQGERARLQQEWIARDGVARVRLQINGTRRGPGASPIR
jgi:hypothetical protein